MSRYAVYEAALWMVRNMKCLSHGKEVLFKKFVNITIDSESNLGFQTKEKAAGSETAWTSPHSELLKVGFLIALATVHNKINWQVFP